MKNAKRFEGGELTPPENVSFLAGEVSAFNTGGRNSDIAVQTHESDGTSPDKPFVLVIHC